MTFKEQNAAAAALSPAEARAAIQSLVATDPRFGAVVRIAAEHYRNYSDDISAQGMATEPGKLAHCAGSMYALKLLVEDLEAKSRPELEAAGEPEVG